MRQTETGKEAAYPTPGQALPSTGPTLISAPNSAGTGTLARVDGELVVTETKTAKSRRVVPLSHGDGSLRSLRDPNAAEE